MEQSQGRGLRDVNLSICRWSALDSTGQGENCVSVPALYEFIGTCDTPYLLLLREGYRLPPFAIERLQMVLGEQRNIGALSALCPAAPNVNPLRPGTSLEPPIDVDGIDSGLFMQPHPWAWEDDHIPSDAVVVNIQAAKQIESNDSDTWSEWLERLRLAGFRSMVCGRVFVANPEQRLVSPVLRPNPDHLEPASPALLLQAASEAVTDNTCLPHAWPGIEPKPVQLHLLHGWGGGAKKWVSDYVQADTNRINLVLISEGNPISCDHGQWLSLYASPLDAVPLKRWPLYPSIDSVSLSHTGYMTILRGLIQQLNVDGLIVSSLIGHCVQALDLSVPTAIVLHDYFPAWPRLDVLFQDTSRFDDTTLAEAVEPTSEGFEFKPGSVPYWTRLRKTYLEHLSKHTLIAPSISVRENFALLAPELNSDAIAVLPHGTSAVEQIDYAAPAPGEKLKIVVLGRMSPHKGRQLLAECLPDLREFADVYLVGCGKGGRPFCDEPGVHLIPDYTPDELAPLLETIRPHAGLLLSVVSETFSYTLAELLALGLPVVATAAGNLETVVSDSEFGVVCELDAASIVAALTALADDPEKLAVMAVEAAAHSHATIAEMVTAHQEAFPLTAHDPMQHGLSADLDGRWALLSASSQDLLLAQDDNSRLSQLREQLDFELEARAKWGFGLQRQLQDRTKWAEALDGQLSESRQALDAMSKQHDAEMRLSQRALDHLQLEFDQRTQWAIELDNLRLAHEPELQRLTVIEAQRERMLASRSWRLTAPVRAATRGARRVRDRLKFARSRLGFNIRRMRNSLKTRGLAGTWQRARRELRQGEKPPALRPSPTFDADAPIYFEPAVQPRASIVIPVFNAWDYTQACLQSLSAAATELKLEVIVVNDASTDQTADRLSRLDSVITLTNPSNLGFIGSCNAGAARARGEYVVFLNNDTTVTDGWLSALLTTFDTHPTAGLAGAKLIYPDGTLQEAGGIIFSDGSGWNFGRGDDPSLPQFEYTRFADYISGAAIALPRELFERLGGFDIRYAPAYYEDTDMAFQVRDAGLQVVYQPRSVVVHYEGISSGTDLSSGAKRFQVLNQGRFRDKWSTALRAQPMPGTPIHLAATHRARRRALVIDACTPTPDQDSGSVRITNLMRLLLDRGLHVSFLAHNMAYEGRYTQALQELGVQALYQPYVTTPHSWLQEFGLDLDFVFISRHYVAIDYLDLIRSACPRAQFVFDTVDLHFLREQRLAELQNDQKIAGVAENTKANELQVINAADITLVVSPVEKTVLAREAPSARVEVLSNIHDVPGRRQDFEQRRDIWFVGGFQHPPNVDAVLYCASEILPLIRAELPDIKLIVVGSKAPAELKSLDQPGLEFRGYVADLDPLLDGCRLAIAPLRYGAGVKGKVNMSMSHGQPVVATPPAVEGMHVEDGREVLVGSDPQSFAAAVVRVYNDPDLWLKLSDAGLANVRKHFSFEAAGNVLDRIVAAE